MIYLFTYSFFLNAVIQYSLIARVYSLINYTLVMNWWLPSFF